MSFFSALTSQIWRALANRLSDDFRRARLVVYSITATDVASVVPHQRVNDNFCRLAWQAIPSSTAIGPGD